MKPVSMLLCVALLSAPAAAAPEWRQSREYEILLSSFDIAPAAMQFRAGEPLRLRLVNNSTVPHSFSAGAFFAAAQIRPRERAAVARGSISVAPGETRTILLVPAAGRYSARCSSLFHRVLGMTARITVE